MTTSAMIKVSLALKDLAGEVDKRLTEIAGERVHFSLFVWTTGRASYISTADRAEVVKAIEEVLAGWKKGMPDVPPHEVS